MIKWPRADWPPKDWRAMVALLFSVLGAVVLTALVWWGYEQLLPDKGWTAASETNRAHTMRWVLWIAIFGIVLVLTGLGFAINRRSLSASWGDKKLDWAGGDENAPPATPGQAARQVGEVAMHEAAAIEEATQP